MLEDKCYRTVSYTHLDVYKRQVLIYYFFFQVGFKAAPPVNMPYVLWLIPGIVPWFFFNEALGAATNSLYDYNYLVKKVVFKVSILPMVKIVSCIFVHAIFIYILFGVYLLYGEMPSIYWLQCIYYSFCTFALVVGLSFITSSINVFFKDMSQIVNIALQFGMWLAPIMWHYSMMPEKFLWLIKLNPVYYIVEGYRDSFITHVGFWNRPLLTLYFWVITGIIFLVGLKLFKRLKPVSYTHLSFYRCIK